MPGPHRTFIPLNPDFSRRKASGPGCTLNELTTHFDGTQMFLCTCKGLEKLQPLCGTSGRHAGRHKGKLYPLQWDSSRFARLHDVPCLLPPSGFAWVSTCSHQLVTRRLVSSILVLKNFNHSVGPAAAMQAGTKGNFTHSSGIPSRFASLHDVPCLLPPSAGFAWVSTCSHQLVTRRLVSSRCKPVKREFTSRTEDLPDTAAESMPRLSQKHQQVLTSRILQVCEAAAAVPLHQLGRTRPWR